ERDHRRRGAPALGVLDDLGTPAFHYGDAGIRRAEVDTNDLAHRDLISKAGPVGPGKHRPDPPGNAAAVNDPARPDGRAGYICGCIGAYQPSFNYRSTTLGQPAPMHGLPPRRGR